MPRNTTNCSSEATGESSWDAGFYALLSQMTCACAESAAHADAPMARALLHRVEEMKQPPNLAARELGIGSGDAAYLLAGLRQDIATDIVVALGEDHPSVKTANHGDTDYE